MRTVALIGLGYVGLPLAYHLAKNGNKVIGFDVSQRKLAELRSGFDSTREVGDKIKDVSILYTDNPEDLKLAQIIIVTVPTPINKQKNPDFVPLEKSSETVGRVLQKGQIVVYESTVHPGCTEEICLPILEKFSGLSCPRDFKIGYSPERINPGDHEHTVDKIAKVVSGCDAESLEVIAQMYGTVTSGVIHRAPSIKVAEASKIIENTQRDINIALMNELSQIFDKVGINTFDVLAASRTKWNFLPFTPGLVGGHCIGVDPYWLAWKAIDVGHHPEIILAGRKINDDMPFVVAGHVVKLLIKAGKKVEGARVLVLGLTFKENVPDFRNSKIADSIKELKDFGVKVVGFDPHREFLHDHDLEELNLKRVEVVEKLEGKFDAVVYATPHQQFAALDIASLLAPDGVVFDVRGTLRGKGFKHYKSL